MAIVVLPNDFRDFIAYEIESSQMTALLSFTEWHAYIEVYDDYVVVSSVELYVHIQISIDWSRWSFLKI